MKQHHHLGKELFTADAADADALREFTDRVRSQATTGARLLILEGPPASGLSRIARAIPDAEDRAWESRDEPEGHFESWGDLFEIVHYDFLTFESAGEFEDVLAKATLPAEQGGKLFAIVAGREIPTRRPEIEAVAVRVKLHAPAMAAA